MCIIMHIPPRTELPPNSVFESARRINSAGIGVMYNNGKEIAIDKTLDYAEGMEFIRKAHKDYNKRECIGIHFRVNACGGQSLENVHPFYTDPDGTQCAYMHNGQLFNVPVTEKRSDSRIFAEDVCKSLPSTWWENDALRALVNHVIVDANDRALFYWRKPDGQTIYQIIGESKGTNRFGIWFSNITNVDLPKLHECGNWSPSPKRSKKRNFGCLDRMDFTAPSKDSYICTTDAGELLMEKCGICDEYVEEYYIRWCYIMGYGKEKVCKDCLNEFGRTQDRRMADGDQIFVHVTGNDMQRLDKISEAKFDELFSPPAVDEARS